MRAALRVLRFACCATRALSAPLKNFARGGSRILARPVRGAIALPVDYAMIVRMQARVMYTEAVWYTHALHLAAWPRFVWPTRYRKLIVHFGFTRPDTVVVYCKWRPPRWKPIAEVK